MRRTLASRTFSSASTLSFIPNRVASISQPMLYNTYVSTKTITTSIFSPLFINNREFSSSSPSLGQKKERPILMVPGPIEFSEAVLNVMSEPTMSHVAPEFIEIFGSTLARVRQVFLASKDSQPFVLAGSGVSVSIFIFIYFYYFIFNIL